MVTSAKYSVASSTPLMMFSKCVSNDSGRYRHQPPAPTRKVGDHRMPGHQRQETHQQGDEKATS
jgi:hypothetical protein